MPVRRQKRSQEVGEEAQAAPAEPKRRRLAPIPEAVEAPVEHPSHLKAGHFHSLCRIQPRHVTAALSLQLKAGRGIVPQCTRVRVYNRAAPACRCQETSLCWAMGTAGSWAEARM